MNLTDLRRDLAIAARDLRGWPKQWWLVETDFAAIWVGTLDAPLPDWEEKPFMLIAGCTIRPVPEIHIDLPMRP